MKTGKVSKIQLHKLVCDMNLYPRHSVDSQWSARLREAVLQGDKLPPIVADKKSLRIVDGWHRHTAYKHLDQNMVVEVEIIDFKDEGEMMEYAVESNAKHGKPLDPVDMKRCIIMLRESGLSTEKISVAMKITEQKVEKLSMKIAVSSSPGKYTVPGTNKIPLKPCAQHLQDAKLTKRQVEAHDSAPGTSYWLLAWQLTEGLQSKLINIEDEKTYNQLVELYNELGKWLNGDA